jgi:uncharacterized protein (DUF58 family)
MRFPDTIFAGEVTPILVSLTNRKRIFPAFSVVAEVRGKERERSIVADELDAKLPKWIASRLGRSPVIRRTLNHFAYLGRNSSVEVRTEHVFPNRGRLSIKDFELSSKFPFGFFRHRRRLPARTADLIVLPRVEPLVVETENIPMDAGNHASGKRGIGLDLLALRDYQPLDDLRHIDWKATARSRRLTVREYADEDEMRVTVIFDTRMDARYATSLSLREKLAAEQAGESVVTSERFEDGVRLAASILARFADASADLRLIIDNDAGEFGQGRPHLHESLRRLAILEPDLGTAQPFTEPDPDRERILNEREDSYLFLLTARGLPEVSSELSQTLKIIRF